MTERLVLHVLAHEAPTPPAGGVVVAAVGRDEVALQIPKLVDLVGLEAWGVEGIKAAVEGFFERVCGFEGANRGRAVYIELAAVLGAVGLERQEHQVVAALVLDRAEALSEGAHALRVVLAPLGVGWKLKDVLEAT